MTTRGSRGPDNGYSCGGERVHVPRDEFQGGRKGRIGRENSSIIDDTMGEVALRYEIFCSDFLKC